MELIVPYFRECINLVSAFMEEIGRSYGANEQERFQLRLIGEETFLFILNGIPKSGLQNTFHLRVMEETDGLTFYFSNHGRPLNVREVPQFDPEKADETTDALSLSLIRSLSQTFSYQSRGAEGWEILIGYAIQGFRSLNSLHESATDYEETAQEPFTVRRATAADVPGIINLAYNVYRYSYVKEFFYDEVTLARLLEEGKLLSFVGVTESGKVVGHNAVLLDSPKLGEAGMAMVDPNYRKSRMFLSLAMQTAREVKANYTELLAYAKCVTSHVRSQAFVSSFVTTFLQLSVYAHANFVGIAEAGTNLRESLVYSVTAFSKRPETQIYVPAAHQAVIQDILDRAKLNTKCLPNEEGVNDMQNSQINLNVISQRQYAELTAESVGADFRKALKELTAPLRQHGILTTCLLLPTDRKLPGELDGWLCAEGYFFSGIKPTAEGSWKLVYTNLLSQVFDFSKVHLFDDDAKALLAYVEKCYQQTL